MAHSRYTITTAPSEKLNGTVWLDYDDMIDALRACFGDNCEDFDGEILTGDDELVAEYTHEFLTCKYCKCCTSVNQYIAEHYDPDGFVKASDSPEETLKTFQAFPDPCPLTLVEVIQYLDELAEAA